MWKVIEMGNGVMEIINVPQDTAPITGDAPPRTEPAVLVTSASTTTTAAAIRVSVQKECLEISAKTGMTTQTTTHGMVIASNGQAS